MFNYAKKVSLNSAIMTAITMFNDTARTLATESEENKATNKELADKLAKAIENEDTESAKTIQGQIDSIADKWKERQKALNFVLFGGKDKDGSKVTGCCGFVSDELYKAYCAYVENGDSTGYALAIKLFCNTLFDGNITESVVKNFYNDIRMTMSSKKYNSNAQLAKGCAFITTINKRTYKKMFCGAIADIVNNNKTLRVAKKSK